MRVARTILCILVAGLVGPWLSSCNYNTISNEVGNEADSFNFPLKQYASQQLRTYLGTPHSLFRISYLEGTTDTTIVDFLTLDWTGILQTFLAADISSNKFAGRYSWSVSDDALLGNRGYTFTAKDPKLFTRLMQVSTDPLANRITSIYIETSKSDFWGARTEKLLYVPQRLIQIQESSKSVFGKARRLRVDYKAMADDNNG